MHTRMHFASLPAVLLIMALRPIAPQRLAANNPIASALGFHHIIENIRTNLIGLSSERLKNQTLDERAGQGKGIFGLSTTNRDIKECNKCVGRD